MSYNIKNKKNKLMLLILIAAKEHLILNVRCHMLTSIRKMSVMVNNLDLNTSAIIILVKVFFYTINVAKLF
ncbi:hypothetical protein C3B55_00742 [Candidatus Pseudomonas adelgestsugas]|uniref:Uncharacterized protein n=1 Tax=Candidatus Pseudomonas adelgestsugas TaxID=1302376 RepID=A0ABX5R8T6_9PSED|nr:hypothetical protein C3B55_00742 [Candidatus Pseudomonas adelgestsugas]